MGLFFTARNGEICEIGTGIVQGYDSKYYYDNFPPLSKDGESLLRHWDGMSTELGSIPKIITLSRAEEKLLSRLRPWKWFKYATRMDYLKLLDKQNRHRLILNSSIIMKNKWANPNSIYHSIEYRENLRLGQIRRWADPEYHAYWSTLMKKIHIPGGCLAQETGRFMKIWWTQGDRRQIWGNKMRDYFSKISVEEKAAQKRQAWETRRKKYGPSGVSIEGGYSKIAQDTWDKVNERGRRRHGERCRRGHAWKKLAQVMDMLFRSGN